MSYLVLARKWRPQTFEDVVGQDVIVKTLQQALRSQRLAHAFLFCGSRGTGKTSLARILAKAICCESGISSDPCGQCGICVSIADGSSLDVIEIDGASNTGVDDVRELKEAIRYQPSQSRFKVFIIDEVHMLSTNAFNALLKTLEEPPAHVKFILATTESHKIPITILSRCQRYDFKRMKVTVICDQLNRILKHEGLAIDPDGLRLIAQVADGGMRDALSLVDQVLSFAPLNPSVSDVSSLLGVSSRKTVMDMTVALLKRDVRAVFHLIEDLDNSGVDLRKFADDVATEVRHFSISKATQSIRGLVDLSDDEIAQIDALAQQYELQDLQRVFTTMLESIDQIARSEQTRMSLELVCLKIADRPKYEDLVSIAQAISRLEAVSKGHPKEKPPPSTPLAQVSTEIKKSRPLEDSKPSNDIQGKWREFVGAVSKANQSIGVYLEHGRPQQDAKVSFEHRFYRDRILEVLQEEWFQRIAAQIYGQDAKIEWVFSEEAEKNHSVSIREARDIEQKNSQAQIEESARNHPIVRKALALFGGEIKAVKKVATLKEQESSDDGLVGD